MKVTIAFMLFALSCFFATCAAINSSEIKEIEPMEQNYLLRRVEMCINKYKTASPEADDIDFQKRCLLNGAFILLGDLDGVYDCELEEILQELECFGMTIEEMEGVITGQTKVYNLDPEVCESTLSGIIKRFEDMVDRGMFGDMLGGSGSLEEPLREDGSVEEDQYEKQLGEVEYGEVEKTAYGAEVSEDGIDSSLSENGYQEEINDHFGGMIVGNDGSTFGGNMGHYVAGSMKENGEGSGVIDSTDTYTKQETNDMEIQEYIKMAENGMVDEISHSTDENGDESEVGVAPIHTSIGRLAEGIKGAIGGQTQGSSWKITESEGPFGAMKEGTFGSKQGEMVYKTTLNGAVSGSESNSKEYEYVVMEAYEVMEATTE